MRNLQESIEKCVAFVRASGGEVIEITNQETIRSCYIKYRCINGHTKNQPLVSILDGRGCVNCARKDRTPRAPVSLPVGTKNGDLEVIEELGVIDGFSRVKVRNSVSGREAVMTPSDFKRMKVKLLSPEQIAVVLSNNGKRNKGKTNSGNAKHTWLELLDICNKMGMEFMHPVTDGKVQMVKTKEWQVRCHCGLTFNPQLNGLLFGGVRSCGCVKSFAQTEVADFLKQFDTIVTNDRTVIAPYEIDIWMPERKLAIEYCGLYWHGEELNREEARAAHVRKWKLCQEKGVRLVTIFEDEWLTKRVVVEGFLRSILNAPSIKIGARKLFVKEVDYKTAKSFLEYHLQGAAGGFSLGLWDKDKLIAVAVFAKPNASRARNDKDGTWELARYCVHPQYRVMGGLSKLIAAFKVAHPEAQSLLSYSDNRWSEGGIYKATGFEMEAVNPPSYWYFKSHTQGPRFHRYKYRKSEALKLFGGEGTEWEINSRNGLDRIWDCGTTRWRLNLNKEVEGDSSQKPNLINT